MVLKLQPRSVYKASAPSLSYSLSDARPVGQRIRQLVDVAEQLQRKRVVPPLFVLETHKIGGNYGHLAPAELALSPAWDLGEPAWK